MQIFNDRKSFNESKADEWNANVDYWIKDMKRDEFSDGTTKKVAELLRENTVRNGTTRVFDIGCGHAWVLDALNNTPGLRYEYTGIDYTHGFISTNRDKHTDNKKAKFFFCDIETDQLPLPGIAGCADIIVNYFNLIEIWNIQTVFNNMSQILHPSGLTIVATADAAPYIAYLSESKDDHNKNMQQYARIKNSAVSGATFGYKSKIPQTKPARYWHNMAHSVSDYVNAARKSGLDLTQMDEISDIKYTNPPKLIMQFKKER